MKLLFSCIILLVSILLELFSGSWGFALVVSAYVIFYLCRLYSVGIGFLAAMLAGFAMDAAYGREESIMPLVLLAPLAVAYYFRKEPFYGALETAMPGMLIGLMSSLLAFVCSFDEDYLQLIFSLIFNAAAGCVMMPVLVLALDAFLNMLNLRGITSPLLAKLTPFSSHLDRYKANESR